MKNHRNMLHVETWSDEDMLEAKKIATRRTILDLVVMIGAFLILLWLCTIGAQASTITIKGYSNADICNAIYWTEGGTKTRHPYGIMTTYKHTTPRQACLNTIKSARNRWNGEGDFIVFLGKTYSPPDINPNWVRLVHWFLDKNATEAKKALT